VGFHILTGEVSCEGQGEGSPNHDDTSQGVFKEFFHSVPRGGNASDERGVLR